MPNIELIDDDIFAPVDDILKRISGATPSPPDRDARERWYAATHADPGRRRRQRKPTLAGALKQASKVGANVKGATVAADGSVSLTFGNAASGNGAAASPDLDRELEEFDARHGQA
jgi:hypothetical protein